MARCRESRQSIKEVYLEGDFHTVSYLEMMEGNTHSPAQTVQSFQGPVEPLASASEQRHRILIKSSNASRFDRGQMIRLLE